MRKIAGAVGFVETDVFVPFGLDASGDKDVEGVVDAAFDVLFFASLLFVEFVFDFEGRVVRVTVDADGHVEVVGVVYL